MLRNPSQSSADTASADPLTLDMSKCTSQTLHKTPHDPWFYTHTHTPAYLDEGSTHGPHVSPWTGNMEKEETKTVVVVPVLLLWYLV